MTEFPCGNNKVSELQDEDFYSDKLTNSTRSSLLCFTFLFFFNMFNLTVILLCLFYYLLIIYHYIMYIV